MCCRHDNHTSFFTPPHHLFHPSDLAEEEEEGQKRLKDRLCLDLDLIGVCVCVCF